MMRHLAGILTTLLVFQWPAPGVATPVYLEIESRYPSGHHPRTWLSQRTRGVQFQRWLRVRTDDEVFGWLPESQLITSLNLASEATLLEDTPGRTETQMDSLGRELFTKGTRVLLIETRGSWARVQPLVPGGAKPTWIPTESLKADLQKRSSRVFAPANAVIYVLPGLHARTLMRLETGKFLEVTGQRNEWLEVKTSRGNGFVRPQDVVTARDLGDKGARALIDQATMRSAPLPYADLVRELRKGERLDVIDAQVLRWGQAKIKKIGQIWWPIVEEASEKDGAQAETLATPELFQRKIFDMSSSPAIPSLKFVSAGGIYRTVNGQDWTKISLFKDQNYPIAIAASGAVFIGPYVSDDHGETFEQWIRWDALMASLRHRTRVAASTLQILEIRPQDPSGRSVLLKLNVGKDEPIRLVTDDQGRSWRRFVRQ